MKLAQVILSTTLLTLSIGPVNASDKTDIEFEKLIKTYKITPKEEQAYCYTDKKGKLQGKNIDKQVRLASVSKLLTSFWAVETKGANYRHETRLFIKGSNLHIQGSLDPFMSSEKMYFLVSQLNSRGYKFFDKITFDKNIQIYPKAQIHTDIYPTITNETNGKYLEQYFNTKSWSKAFKNEYDRQANLAKVGRFERSVEMRVNSVEFSATNPLVGKDVKMLTLASPELYKYLKEINVKSNNYAAHAIFRSLGGAPAFEKFLATKLSLTSDKIKMFTGSGLPMISDGKRYDNYATCAIVNDLVSELKGSLERQGKELEDVVAVPGNDGGTFRRRLNTSDFKNTFVAKTGTLMHTSTLAGALSTKNGFSFFGIYNSTSDITSAKSVQNSMVRVLMNEMGGPKVFGYRVEGFHAYDNGQVVKSLELFDDEDENNDFSVIAGDLE
jgi:D-alanyl-D-alanine carboxypeptidase/D-alanyl-D-alanine-endopeptidase (penicillin-binding protein 4)